MAGVVRHWTEQEPANSHGAVGWKVFTERKDGLLPEGEKQAVLVGGGVHGFTYRLMQPHIEEPVHDHENKEHVIFVIKGKGKVHLDGNVTEVKAGDSVYIPPHCKHALINDSDDWLEHVLVSGLVE